LLHGLVVENELRMAKVDLAAVEGGGMQRLASDHRTMLRVHTVGSFLRPQALIDAFAGYGAGTIDRAQLTSAQDAAIDALLAAQERHGLPIVTDGEFRREIFMQSFTDVAGMELWLKQTLGMEHSRKTTAAVPLTKEEGTEVRRPVTRRLALERNQILEEYAYVARQTTRPAKVTLIGPDRLSQRYDADGSQSIYADTQAFLDDVVRVQREMIAQVIEAGCGYVQIDEPSYTSYVDEQRLAVMRAAGEDPAANLARSIAADNAIVDAFPGITFGIHLCRGNARSQWHRTGGYDAVAEQLFTGLHHERLLLEYDDDRSGGFEPLRFLPKGKIAVLGLITTKRGTMETVDELKRRIDEAAHFAPIEQLALSPQCGFASSILGNLLTVDDQWRKIDVMLETAQAVWG